MRRQWGFDGFVVCSLFAAISCAAEIGDEAQPANDALDLNELDVAETSNSLVSTSYTAPAIVVGSGYGGSVAALRLGEKNVTTLVLERGRRWPVQANGTVNQPFATMEAVAANIGNPAPANSVASNSTWLNTRCVGNLYINLLAAQMVPTGCVRTTGILEVVDAAPAAHRDAAPLLQLNNLTAVVAAGVGGGSLVNNGLTFPPTQLAWDVAYPNATYPYMKKVWKDLDKKYFSLANGVLAPQVLPADLLNDPHYRAIQLTRDQAAAAGYPMVDTFDPTTKTGMAFVPVIFDWNKVRQELTGARVPSAVNGEVWWGNNSGARKSLDTPQSYIGRAEATGRVTIKPLHTVTDVRFDQQSKLYVLSVVRTNEAYDVQETLELTTPNLVMSAGSLGTTKLLVRAKARGTLPRLNEYVGANFSNNGNMVHLRETKETTPIGQGGPGGLRINDFAQANNPVVLETLPQRVPPIPALAKYTTKIFSVGLGVPTGKGTFVYDSAADTVVLTWPADGAKNVYDRVTELYETKFGSTLDVDIRPLPVSGRTTLHPLGGMPLGLATNKHCKVKGYKRLYVVDGSVLPNSSAAANPSFLITAMSERCMAKIVKSVAGGDDAWEDDAYDDTNDE
ncbi:MAG TPA: GMC oxidoreductase [Polyangiales bacterium]|nr:GMC oxidoreductase [Polyangiales bacterium]